MVTSLHVRHVGDLCLACYNWSSLLGLGLRTFTETIPELALHNLHVPHPACSGCPTSNSLEAPVISPLLLSRVSAARTSTFLYMVASAAASPTEGMRLVMPLTKTGCTFRHLGCKVP